MPAIETQIFQGFAVRAVEGGLTARLDTKTVGAPEQAPNTPPTVVVSPPPGHPLAPQSPVFVYVRDAEGLRRTTIMVVHARGIDVAWDGSAFAVGYRTSERSEVGGGEDFTLRREAGWPASGFTLRVLPLDAAGEEG